MRWKISLGFLFLHSVQSRIACKGVCTGLFVPISGVLILRLLLSYLFLLIDKDYLGRINKVLVDYLLVKCLLVSLLWIKS